MMQKLLALLFAASAAAGSTTSYFQVRSAYWNGDRTRDLELRKYIQSQDSSVQQLQCILLLRRKWQLGRNECAVLYRGSASPCFIGTIRAHNCENLRPPSGGGDEDVKVWVTSPIRDFNCTMIQHRVSASVNFYRNWIEYVNGFGEGPSGNFWLGLESLQLLTNPNPRGLYMEMTLWNGSVFWASYPSFQVGPASDHYRLLSLGAFSSSNSQIGNCMSSCLNQNFSTFDADFDTNPAGSCSYAFKGGWWYASCHCTNPNGLYRYPPEALNGTYAIGIVWNVNFGYYYSMMEFKMMLW